MMVDPDAPDPDDPRFRNFLHWLVYNIPSDVVKKGKTAVDYIGAGKETPVLLIQCGPLTDPPPLSCPGPGRLSSAHRFVFLLFEQR